MFVERMQNGWEIDSLKNKVRTHMFVVNIEDFLLGNGHDVRMEELIVCLKEQLVDNPQWMDDFMEGQDE